MADVSFAFWKLYISELVSLNGQEHLSFVLTLFTNRFRAVVKLAIVWVGLLLSINYLVREKLISLVQEAALSVPILFLDQSTYMRS